MLRKILCTKAVPMEFSKCFASRSQFHSSTPRSSWEIGLAQASNKNEIVVITMNSNKVNAINSNFLDDADGALSALNDVNSLYYSKPVVITAKGGHTFSAGLDLLGIFNPEDSKEDTRKNLDQILKRLGRFLLQVYSLPIPTVAALNGHALAGGQLLAMACDWRVAVSNTDHKASYGLTEIKVGVPLPCWAFEIASQALPTERRREAMLLGRVYDTENAIEANIIHDSVSNHDELVSKACQMLETISPMSLPAFGSAKMLLSAPVLQRCDTVWEKSHKECLDLVFSDQGWSALQATMERMMAKKKNK